MNMNEGVLNEKKIDRVPFMPPCIVNPEIYDFTTEPMDYLVKDLHETYRVSPYPFHDAMSSIDRIYPAKDIQSMLMLAACIHI